MSGANNDGGPAFGPDGMSLRDYAEVHFIAALSTLESNQSAVIDRGQATASMWLELREQRAEQN